MLLQVVVIALSPLLVHLLCVWIPYTHITYKSSLTYKTMYTCCMCAGSGLLYQIIFMVCRFSSVIQKPWNRKMLECTTFLGAIPIMHFIYLLVMRLFRVSLNSIDTWVICTIIPVTFALTSYSIGYVAHYLGSYFLDFVFMSDDDDDDEQGPLENDYIDN